MEKNVVVQDNFMQWIIEKNPDVEKIEKFLELKIRMDQIEAKKAFNSAMVRAQTDMPIVPKDKKNDQTNSWYSKYETILRFCKPIYTREGFSIMFYEGECPNPEEVRIMADIMHEQGHTETRHTDIPKDQTGMKGNVNKTPIHGKGSQIQYGRGYLIKMIFNIPTGDDNDGNTASMAITETQVKTLDNILKELKGDKRKEKFLAYMKVDSLEKINEKDFKKALMAVSKARDGK